MECDRWIRRSGSCRNLARNWRDCGLRVNALSFVMAFSTFLHVGRIRQFQQARQLGDVLLTLDRYVNKGANRPAFLQEPRAEVIASLECVDFVAVNLRPTP